MKVTNVSDFKNRLSAHIESARSGNPVLVTDRRHPVALLQPIDLTALPPDLQVLWATGVASPAQTQISVDEFLALPKARNGKGLTSAILEERNER